MPKPNTPTPPRWSTRLLRLFICKDFLEEIEGDMEEIFLDEVEEYDKRKARRRYNWQMMRLLRKNLIKKPGFASKYMSINSINQYIRTSTKLILRNKYFSLLNIAGLALAIACFVFLGTFIKHELTYDRQISEGENIYKLIREEVKQGNRNTSARVPHSMAEAFHLSSPEIIKSAHFAGPFRESLITYEDAKGTPVNYYENVVAADSALLELFEIPMIYGNRETALKEPVSMVLSQSMAHKHFGDENPLGKTIHMSRDNFTVTGVFEDLPQNSHLNFDIIISIHTIGRFNNNNFTRPDVNTYFKLSAASSPQAVEEGFTSIYENLAAPEIERRHLLTVKEFQAAGNSTSYSLVPLYEVYHHPAQIGGLKRNGNLIVLRVLMVVAILILALAVVNFSNLSTTLLTKRSKSAGVKKVLGSGGPRLFYEFITESILLSCVGALIALFIIKAFSSSFNQLTGIEIEYLSTTSELILLLAFAIILGIFAGLYPAILSANIRPLLVLKGQLKSGVKGRRLKNGLMIFQFTIAIALVFGVLVMGQQIKYIINKDLGYDQDHLLIVTGNFHMYPNFVETYMAEARNFPEVASVAGSLTMPGLGIFWNENYQVKGSIKTNQAYAMKVGDGLPETLGLELITGNLFSSTTNDSLSVVLNTSALQQFEIEEPIGQTISLIDADGNKQDFEIIGVVEDFNYTDLYTQTGPLVIHSNEIIYKRSQQMVARITGSQSLEETIDKFSQLWSELRPGHPFSYSFASDISASFYSREIRLKKILKLASIVSIAIAILGLFALTSLSLSLRKAELGIRKVLGANAWQIGTMVLKKLSSLVLIAYFVGVPLAWYIVETWWLKHFAYRTEVNIGSLILIGIGAIAMAWITIGVQTFKAATTNPVNSIKNE